MESDLLPPPRDCGRRPKMVRMNCRGQVPSTAQHWGLSRTIHLQSFTADVHSSQAGFLQTSSFSMCPVDRVLASNDLLAGKLSPSCLRVRRNYAPLGIETRHGWCIGVMHIWPRLGHVVPGSAEEPFTARLSFRTSLPQGLYPQQQQQQQQQQRRNDSGSGRGAEQRSSYSPYHRSQLESLQSASLSRVPNSTAWSQVHPATATSYKMHAGPLDNDRRVNKSYLAACLLDQCASSLSAIAID